MPIRRIDSHSGAVLFDPTPEEKAISDLRSEVEELKKLLLSTKGVQEDGGGNQ